MNELDTLAFAIRIAMSDLHNARVRMDIAQRAYDRARSDYLDAFDRAGGEY